MVHGTTSACRRVIVLPYEQKMATDLTKALQRLGIETVNFRLDEEKATII
jgi:hypothetical protein